MSRVEEPPVKQAKVTHIQKPGNVFNFNVARTPVGTEAEFQRLYDTEFQPFDPQSDVPDLLPIPDTPQMVESQSWPKATRALLWSLGTKRGESLFVDRQALEYLDGK